MKNFNSKLVLLFAFFLMASPHTFAQTTAARVFNNHMVLQRNISIPVWGKSEPGTNITVQLGPSQIETTTDINGKWIVDLPAMKAGGPYVMTIISDVESDSEIKFEDVLIGDVWVASGQSNMEWHVEQAMNAEEEIANADYPEIRFLKVPHDKQIESQDDILKAEWQVCDTSSVKDKSAVAYYFARNLLTEINVPIGIIQSTWGGTPVEAWTSREQLLASAYTQEKVINHDSVTLQHFIKDSLDLIEFWDIVYNPKNETDKTVPSPDYKDKDWAVLEMPKTFKDWDMDYYEGMVWFRKSISIPKKMAEKDLTLSLGVPEMNYSIYINGEEICKTVWNANPSHSYTIPADLIKSGTNVISARIAVLWGGGGFNPPADSMFITDGKEKISIAGDWKYKKDLETSLPKINNYHQYPTYLYNAMINPIIPYGIKGFIWYQGENNAENALEYRELFPAMITDWRIRWQQGYLPFIFVQLANYMKIQPEPSESNWALLREAQTLTLQQPNTGMACIIDLGEADNIHPKNKQEVGRRVALVAEKLVYDKVDLDVYGPIYKSFTRKDNSIIIDFVNGSKGLSISEGEKLTGFAIAGEDKVFHWAEAVIDGDKIIVKSAAVKSPVAVRYAWADNPVCNLTNSTGLPALPFRTDNW